MILEIASLEYLGPGRKAVDPGLVFKNLLSVLAKNVEIGVEEANAPSLFPGLLPLDIDIGILTLIETENPSGLCEYIYVSLGSSIGRDGLLGIGIVKFFRVPSLDVGPDDSVFPYKVELLCDFKYRSETKTDIGEKVFGRGISGVEGLYAVHLLLENGDICEELLDVV